MRTFLGFETSDTNISLISIVPTRRSAKGVRRVSLRMAKRGCTRRIADRIGSNTWAWDDLRFCVMTSIFLAVVQDGMIRQQASAGRSGKGVDHICTVL